MSFDPSLQRIVTKATSVRAACLMLMVATLCVMVFVSQTPEWQRVFEGALLALLGNYLGRNHEPPKPTGVA